MPGKTTASHVFCGVPALFAQDFFQRSGFTPTIEICREIFEMIGLQPQFFTGAAGFVLGHMYLVHGGHSNQIDHLNPLEDVCSPLFTPLWTPHRAPGQLALGPPDLASAFAQRLGGKQKCNLAKTL